MVDIDHIINENKSHLDIKQGRALMQPYTSSSFFHQPVTSLLCLLLVSLLAITPVHAVETSQRLIQMLDYIGVDYPQTVHNGEIADPVEYAEMQEFSGEVSKLLSQLPDHPQKATLLALAQQLKQGVEQRLAGEALAQQATALKQKLINTYAIPVGPEHAPDQSGVAKLFKSQCASCHGITGKGDGPLATTLNPPPSNFHDMQRQYHRSVYDLYNTISLGVTGTPMPAFEQLTEQQRWALAFYISRFSATQDQREKGKALWQQGKLHSLFSSLPRLTGSSYATAGAGAITQQLDESQGAAVLSYLREHPEELDISDHVALDKSIELLEIAVEKARQGNANAAHTAALSAYLDGFELAEPSLAVVDSTLKKQIEAEMITFRELARNAQVVQMENTQKTLLTLLHQAKTVLNTTRMSSSSAFFGSFIILLREGVEAILVLAAIMAALIKTGRREAIKYIHAGWIGAVIAGIFTWWIAENLISISGASREITEGIAALLAAAILIYVGFWLHNASNSQRWQKFVQHKVNSAMEDRTLWILATVSFVAVYREMFETVLFYQAMWVQVETGSQQPFLMGIVTAITLLVIIAVLVFRVGTRLPIKQFFQINAILLFILAVIFTGQGVSALQEAGMIPAKLITFPSIEILGIYPTVQGLGLQFAVLILGIGLMLYHRKEKQRQRQT